MKIFGAALSLGLFAALCACGGGANGGAVPAPAATAPPTSLPSPFGINGQFEWLGSDASTQTNLSGPPSPSTSSGTLDDFGQYLSGVSFEGNTNLDDLSEHEITYDSFGNASPVSYYHNYYIIKPTTTGENLLFLAASSSSQISSTETVSDLSYFPVPNIDDELPHTTGNSWTHTFAETYTSDDNDTGSGIDLAVNYQINSDYSGVETITSVYPGGSYVETLTGNSDGSGVKTVIYNRNPETLTTERVGLPVPGVHGLLIPITDTGANGKVTASRTIPDYYPNGSPLPLVQYKTVDEGPTVIPPSCAVGSSVSRTAEKLSTASQSLDVYGGYEAGVFSTLKWDEYVEDNVGTVCIIQHQITQGYPYDGSMPTQNVDDGALWLKQFTPAVAAATATALNRHNMLSLPSAARGRISLLLRERRERTIRSTMKCLRQTLAIHPTYPPAACTRLAGPIPTSVIH